MYAPVALFVYKRPDHTRRTLAALAKNELAQETDLIVFSDAPAHSDDEAAVEETRKIIANQTGFRSVICHERETNAGLATNIIQGVSAMCKVHGRVIVMEDDLVTAPGFLRYMNDALTRYESEKRVWHISGWNYPLAQTGAADAYFWPTMNCWGWATWADRWAQFHKDPAALLESWRSRQIRDFNQMDREDFWRQVEMNADGRKNTWAIFWYAKIFESGGLCLNPWVSFVENIGLDGTGENSGTQAQEPVTLNSAAKVDLPDLVQLDEAAQQAVWDHMDARRAKPARHRRKLRLRRWKKYGIWR